MFPSPPKNGGPDFLRFGGLDTRATAYLNGTRIGSLDNIYREYSVEVSRQLSPAGGGNVLLVVFLSPLKYIEALRQPPEHEKIIAKHKYLRKAYNDFNTYFGWQPHSVKVGIFRDVVLDCPGPAWIEDVWVRPRLSADLKSAVLGVSVETGGGPATVRLALKDPAGWDAGSGTSPVENHAGAFEIAVRNPELW